MGNRARRTGPAAAVAAMTALLLSLLVVPAAGAAEGPPPVEGSLSGSVRDTDGRAVSATVQFFAAGAMAGQLPEAPARQTRADGDGGWSIAVADTEPGLPPGDYLIKIDPDGDYPPRWYRDAATPAETSDDATLVTAATGVDRGGLDVELPSAPPDPGPDPKPDPEPRGEMSGRVSDTRGSPIANAEVTIYRTDPSGDPAATTPAATATSSADGSWRIPTASIDAGAYLVTASADPLNYRQRWYPDSPTPQGATPVQVDPGKVLAGIDLVLPDVPTTGTLRGRVVANGKRVPAATVTAVGPAGAVGSATTDERGRYALDALPAGDYLVRASTSQYLLPSRWYPDLRARRSAETVAVTAGQTRYSLVIDMSYQPVHPGGKRVRARGPKMPGAARALPVDTATRYQGQRRCIPRSQPGAASLYYLIKKRYGNITIGLNRACRKDTSEHYDGRALDWMVSIRNKSQARKGDSFTKWLTKTRGLEVGAMARRLGVMYVIWRDRIWKQYQADKGWQRYYDCGTKKKQRWFYDRPCHRDHVHISMNWPGAKKRTSWWATA